MWTFTWFVHFELPFRLKRTDKIHTEGLTKFHSNIYSILFVSSVLKLCLVKRTFLLSKTLSLFYNKTLFYLDFLMSRHLIKFVPISRNKKNYHHNCCTSQNSGFLKLGNCKHLHESTLWSCLWYIIHFIYSSFYNMRIKDLWQVECQDLFLELGSWSNVLAIHQSHGKVYYSPL